MDVPEDMIKRVVEAREAKGWSQSDLAKVIGKEPQSIQQLESGRTANPTFILELAEALGIDPYYLKFGRRSLAFIDHERLSRLIGLVEKILLSQGINAPADVKGKLIALAYEKLEQTESRDWEKQILYLLIANRSLLPEVEI